MRGADIQLEQAMRTLKVVGRDSNGNPILKIGRRIYYHTQQTVDGKEHYWSWYRRINGRMCETVHGLRFPAEAYERMKQEASGFATGLVQEGGIER